MTAFSTTKILILSLKHKASFTFSDSFFLYEEFSENISKYRRGNNLILLNIMIKIG